MNMHRARSNALWAMQAPEPATEAGLWWRKFMLSGGVDRREWKAAREAASRALRMARFDCLEKLEELVEELQAAPEGRDVDTLVCVEREICRLRRALNISGIANIEKRRQRTRERMGL